MNMVDFTACPIDKIADYRGHSGQKKGILYNNERYILKYAEDVEMSYNKQFRDSLSPELRPKYSNDPYTEHMSCQILKRLGFDLQASRVVSCYRKRSFFRETIISTSFIGYLQSVLCKE